MTQGAPKNTRPVAKKHVEPESGDETFDLDAWLGERDLIGRRLMKVGGEWFEFDRSATSAQLINYSKAREAGGIVSALGELLSDPDQKDALSKAFDVQRQPIAAHQTDEYIQSIADFIIHGDAEHTAKAKQQDKEKAAAGESSAS